MNTNQAFAALQASRASLATAQSNLRLSQRAQAIAFRAIDQRNFDRYNQAQALASSFRHRIPA